MMTGGTRLLRFAAIGLVAVLPYLNSLRGEFVFDDYELVVGNPMTAPGASPSRLFTPEAVSGAAYRPLTLLTYLANARVGADPVGYHAVNVVLHALATLAVLGLAGELLGSSRAAEAAAVIFAVHPVHTEAVANIAGRAELLAGLFVLLSLLASLRGQRDGAPRRAWWTAASVAAFAAGLLCKESAFTTIPLLAIVHAAATPRGRPRVLAPHLVVGAGYLALRFLVVRSLTQADVPPFLDNPLAHVDRWPRLATAVVVLWDYLSTLALPLRLSADESFDQVPVVASALEPRFLVAFGMLVLVVAALIVVRRRAPALALGALLAAAAMSLTANLLFPIGTIKAERLLYLPSVGWCMAAGWLVARWTSDGRRWRTAAVALAGIALALRTWVRNDDWQSNFTLFTATVRVAPNSARAQQNVAAVYGMRGQLDRAIFHYRRALEIDPSYASAARGLAKAYELHGRARPREASR